MIKSEFLELNMTDMSQDGNEHFDFDVDLNQNWKKIDEYSNALSLLVGEKDFEITCLGKMIELGLTKMFVQIFEDTSTLSTSKGDGAYCIANYYQPKAHIFIKNDDSEKVIYSIAKQVTTGNNKVFALVDWESVENATLKMEVSRDGGTTWTTLTLGELTDISSQPTGTSMIIRLTVTGKLKLKNIAWGMKG